MERDAGRCDCRSLAKGSGNYGAQNEMWRPERPPLRSVVLAEELSHLPPRTSYPYSVPRISRFVPRIFLLLTSHLLPLSALALAPTVPGPVQVVTRGAPNVRPCLSNSPPRGGGRRTAAAVARRAGESAVRRAAARDRRVRAPEPRRRDPQPGRRRERRRAGDPASNPFADA